MTDPKPRINDEAYVERLRRMTPSQRLDIASDLSDSVRDLFLTGLRQRHPELDEAALKRLMLRHLYPECYTGNR